MCSEVDNGGQSAVGGGCNSCCSGNSVVLSSVIVTPCDRAHGIRLPAILVFQLFPSVFAKFPTYSNLWVLLSRKLWQKTSKRRKYQNSANFAVNK